MNIRSLATRASSPGASLASRKASWPPAFLTDWTSKIRRFSSLSMPFLSNWQTKALMMAAGRRGSRSNHSLCSQAKAAAQGRRERWHGAGAFGVNPVAFGDYPRGGLTPSPRQGLQNFADFTALGFYDLLLFPLSNSDNALSIRPSSCLSPLCSANSRAFRKSRRAFSLSPNES